MKEIKIGFSTTRKFNVADYIIRKHINEDFSHTYVVMPDNRFVFEANFFGVMTIPIDEWTLHKRVVLEVSVTISEERYREISGFINLSRGLPYGYFQLVKILFDMKWCDNGDKSYICSELVARALYEELNFDPNERLDLITPKDIFHKVNNLIIKEAVNDFFME